MGRLGKITLSCVGIVAVLLISFYLLIWLLQIQQEPAVTTTVEMTSVAKTVVVTTPASTPQVIASINLIEKPQDDGSIQTVAELSMAPLTIGTFDIVASQVMTVDQPSLITLLIDPGTGLIELTRVPLETRTRTPDGSDHLLKVTEELEIYPVMTAELTGAASDFGIEDVDSPTKPIIFGQLTTWKWRITPKRAGDKSLLLQISIPVEVAGEIYENAQMLAQKELSFQVNALPVKTPTPTPSMSKRFISEAQNNIFPLVISLLVLGVVVAFIWWFIKHWRSSTLTSFDKSSPEGHTAEQLAQLLSWLDGMFNEEEFQTLCFRMNIQYDNLPARGKINKIRELIEYCRRQERVEELIDSAEEMRPSNKWAKVRTG